LTISHKRWFYALWLLFIGCFALLHALHLSADFPNHSPWFGDWAKYTDEGWYGNAAIRAHLFGHWYLPGDFTPAPALPVWPFLEWVLFFFTGVSIQAARGLAVAIFIVNLLLSYLLLKDRGPRWMGLLALTLMVTSPFLYCFSRLAILEPMMIALTLAALNLAVRLPRLRWPVSASVAIGLICTLMVLTKTTGVSLLPAVGWAMLVPLWNRRKLAVRCAAGAMGTFAVLFSLWMGIVIHFGLFADYRYLFFVNNHTRPPEYYWPLVSLWWSFHGGLWVDRILIPLAGVMVLGAAVAWRSARARKLLLDPVFGASVLAVGGYVLFMASQNYPQPRYFAVVAYFCFVVVAQGVGALIEDHSSGSRISAACEALTCQFRHCVPFLGWAVVALLALGVGFNGFQTLNYATHPEYSFVNAARRLTQYIDAHPNGRRILVSSSGDEISLITHLPALCDEFGTEDLALKLARYRPGWYAAWNDLDPGTLESIHTYFSLEEVASFRAFDNSERNVLELFKLHPLASGEVRDPNRKNLQIPLAEDKIEVPMQ
jgi:hypothetical protein